MIFISKIFHFRIIHEFLNLRVSMQLTKIAIQKYVYSILAKLLNREAKNSRILGKIKFSRTFRG